MSEEMLMIAPPVRLTLEPNSKRNFHDDAGRWHFEAGKVFLDGRHVANYASHVREQKVLEGNGMLTMTIFFLGSQPPENITLQGSYDFGVKQTGSVSAASRKFAAFNNVAFTRTDNTLELS